MCDWLVPLRGEFDDHGSMDPASAVRITPMASGRPSSAGAVVTVPGRRPRPVLLTANVDLVGDATPWLPMGLPLAMSCAAPLVIDGAVDTVARAKADQAQQVLAGWFPQWTRVAVSATEGAATIDRPAGVGAFFSGGLDSLYTAITRSHEITHLIFVLGFDVQLRDPARAARVLGATRRAARILGKPLIEVRTNLRHVSDTLAPWYAAYHGAAMGAVAQSLGDHIGTVLIPSSWPVGRGPVQGSHPDLDHLWSSSRVKVVHDITDADRIDKARVLAAHPGMLENLRVCWQNAGSEINCGECEKCIRTAINLIAAGAAGACPSLPSQVDGEAVARLGDGDVIRRFQAENLEALRRLPDGARDRRLERALADVVAEN